MASHYRHRRTSTAATPFPTPVEPGEIVANTANRQLVIGDAASATLGQPLALLAVRFFDARAQYAVGDFVVQAGALYCANTAIVPGAFNATQWDALAAADVNKAYVDAGDAAVTTAFQNADNNLYNSTQAGFDAQTTAMAAKVAKAGDTMTGPLVAPNGSAAAVGVAVGAAGTGMYNNSGALALAAAGALKLTLSATGITPAAPFKQIDGTLSNPAYNFGLENSGLYRKSAANISMSVTQQEVMSWNGTTKVTTTFGPLVLPTDPVNPLEAATKQYVDAHGAPAAATAAEYISNSAPTKMLTPGAVWGAAASVDLGYVASVAPNFSLGLDFYWTLLTATCSIANPTNAKAGQKGVFLLAQDGPGGRLITSWGSAFKFPGGIKPTLSTAPSAVDVVSYTVYSPTFILCTFSAGFA